MVRSARFTPTDEDRSRHLGPADDITEWLDWSRWQGVEEFQTIVDGLGAPPLDESTEGGEAAGETARRQLRRRLYRCGIELEG